MISCDYVAFKFQSWIPTPVTSWVIILPFKFFYTRTYRYFHGIPFKPRYTISFTDRSTIQAILVYYLNLWHNCHSIEILNAQSLTHIFPTNMKNSIKYISYLNCLHLPSVGQSLLRIILVQNIDETTYAKKRHLPCTVCGTDNPF